MIDEEFRPPTEWERKLLFRLMEQRFVGRTETLQQLDGILVRQYDEHDPPCLDLQVTSHVQLPIRIGCIIMASYIDSTPGEGWMDRIDKEEWLEHVPRVRILLHVLDWKLVHLEIVKDDSSPVLRRPTLDELELTTFVPS